MGAVSMYCVLKARPETIIRFQEAMLLFCFGRGIALLAPLLLTACPANCDWWTCYDSSNRPMVAPVYVPPVQQPTGSIYGPYGPRQTTMCTLHGNMILCN